MLMTKTTAPDPVTPAGIRGDGRPFSRKMVAFSDCDPFGILYNTRFLDYVLDTRHEHTIAHYGTDFLSYFSAKEKMLVIVSHQVSYFEPARAHETVLIATTTAYTDDRSLISEGAITSEDGRRLKFLQWTRLKAMDPKTGAATSLDDETMADMRRMMSSENVDRGDYDGRVKAILASMRD